MKELEYFLDVYEHIMGQRPSIGYQNAKLRFFESEKSLDEVRPKLVEYKDYLVFEDLIDKEGEETNTYIPVDLIKASFIMLSNLYEYLFEIKHKKTTGSYFARLNFPKEMFKKPWVNYYIEHISEKLGIKNESKFTLMLSHDVDYTRRNWLLRLKYLVMAFRKKQSLPSINYLFRKKKYLKRPIADMEKEMNSIFFVYSKIKTDPRSILIDPSYDISEEKSLHGVDLGIHGSYRAGQNNDLFRKEIEKLRSLGKEIIYNRLHWLNYSFLKTPGILETNGIQFDSTLGFNDLPGYRNCCASPFPIFNHSLGKASKVIEVPMIIMDSSLFNYCKMDDEKAFLKSKELLDEAKRFGGRVSINWHFRTASNDYGWYSVYEKILNEYEKDILG